MIILREYQKEDMKQILPLWNEVVEEGGSFPFEEPFTSESLQNLIHSHVCAVVACNQKQIEGMYIMGPNLFGRCDTIANATYLVKKESRGKHIGEMLVKDSLKKAKEYGFRIMQFNGVVDSNIHARHLYRRCGFTEIGVLPKGFRVKDGHYEDMHIMYHEL